MDIKSILGKIGLGAAAAGATAANVMTGGAVAPLTNTIVTALGKVLDPTAKQQLDLAVAQQQDELQKAEWDHAEKIAAIAQANMASAREREMAVKDKVPGRLAYVTVAFFLAYIVFVTFKHTVVDAVMLGTILGYLIKCVGDIYGYYFGSSAGSQAKSETIEKLTGQK